MMVTMVMDVADEDKTVSFVQALSSSVRFQRLFAEGMELVEETAGYLDSAGREEARMLPEGLQPAYSAESMRLTTRLMQIASWLLIRRAVGSGEMTPAEAATTRVRVRLSAQAVASAPAVFQELPERLQALTARSLRLQTRILHLDRMVNVEPEDPALARRGLDQQLDLLRSAFRSVA